MEGQILQPVNFPVSKGIWCGDRFASDCILSHTAVRSCSRSSVFVHQPFEIAAEIFLRHSHIFVDDRLQPEKLTVSMVVSRANTVSKIDAEIPSCL